jgi:hypothetical protein
MNMKINRMVALMAAGSFAGWLVGSCLAQAGPAAPAAPAPPAPPAAAKADPKTSPHIAFDATVYQFGKANAGELVRHDFVFTNTGAATLDILEVRPGCGCTTAGTWDKKVEPGKTGSIPLQFNSSGFSGTVTKSATVTCNDPTQPSLTLQITGNVFKPIDVTPTMLSFTAVADMPTNETKSIRIVNHTDEMITLSDVKSSNPAFTTELKTITPGKEFEMLVTTHPPFKTPTAYASITAKTSSAKMPTVNMSAYLQVQQEVSIVPDQLILHAAPLTNVANLTVTVRYNGSNSMLVTSANINHPDVKVYPQEMQKGRVFAIRASFPVGFQIPAGQKIEISATTDHPKYPVIKIPVYQSAVPFPSPAVQVPPLRPTATNANRAPSTAPVPSRAALPPVPKN